MMQRWHNRALVLGTLMTMGACGETVDVERNVPQAMPTGANVMDVGTHEIHVNALTTDMIPPEVAQSYGIVRSKQRALLNVAIRDKDTQQTVESELEVSAVNLTGQRKNIDMRPVHEPGIDGAGDAVYYIGEVPVANRETLLFDVNITLPGSDEVVGMKFKRQFFSE